MKQKPAPQISESLADADFSPLPDIGDYTPPDFVSPDMRPLSPARPVPKDGMIPSEPSLPSFADSFPLSWFGDAPLQDDD